VVQKTKAQEVQQTPSVLLPEKYLENVRAPLKIGSAAPDFSLSRCAYDKSTPEETVQLSKWRDAKKNGGVIVFWAFWCDTWKDMTRDLNVLRPQLNAMKLQVLAVAVDASQQPVARRAFEEKKIWWPVAIDEKSTVSAAWGVRRVPTVFVLDKNGAVARVYEGFPGRQTFIKETARVLGLKAPPTSRRAK
jgi:peroxiredoxin